jgi:hypothetical protein
MAKSGLKVKFQPVAARVRPPAESLIASSDIPRQPSAAILPSYCTAAATAVLHYETIFTPTSFRYHCPHLAL